MAVWYGSSSSKTAYNASRIFFLSSFILYFSTKFFFFFFFSPKIPNRDASYDHHQPPPTSIQGRSLGKEPSAHMRELRAEAEKKVSSTPVVVSLFFFLFFFCVCMLH
jgi:hypothetical protein